MKKFIVTVLLFAAGIFTVVDSYAQIRPQKVTSTTLEITTATVQEMTAIVKKILADAPNDFQNLKSSEQMDNNIYAGTMSLPGMTAKSAVRTSLDNRVYYMLPILRNTENGQSSKTEKLYHNAWLEAVGEGAKATSRNNDFFLDTEIEFSDNSKNAYLSLSKQANGNLTLFIYNKKN